MNDSMFTTKLEMPGLFEPELKYVHTPKYRTRKTQIVLLGGKGQVGKTTAAMYLLGRLSAYDGILAKISPLASPIKLNAYEFYRWDGLKDERGRTLLQEIGDAGRKYNEDIFCEYLEEREGTGIFPSNFVLVDDWRYPNESEYFRKNWMFEVTTVRIERPSELPGETSKHISENALPLSEVENLVYNDCSIYNFEVHNFGTLDEYYKKLDSVVDYLATKIITY